MGTEPYRSGVDRLLDSIRARIGHRDEVTVMEGNSSDLRTDVPGVIVYDPSAPSLRSTGTPLLVTALCPDRTLWPHIHEAFITEGFDPLTPEPGNGRVCYASRETALLVVEAHPGATRAVDRTGTALLTSIVH